MTKATDFPIGSLLRAVPGQVSFYRVNWEKNSYTPIIHAGHQVYLLCRVWEQSKHSYAMLLTEEGTAVYYRHVSLPDLRTWFDLTFEPLT
jgi:hypothetical protein